MGTGRGSASPGKEGSALRFLQSAAIEEITVIKGIGLAKAIQLKAAMEIGRRVGLELGEKVQICSAADVGRLLMEEMRYLEQESFRTILLDARNRVISVETNSVGTLDSSTAHPREIFKAAIRKNAASLILVHNHPSGDPAPTREDVQVTRVLAEAGRLLGIEVVDHLVIGDNRYVSFREQGIRF